MEAPRGTFIQFACDARQTVNKNLFTKYFLEKIIQEDMDITEILQQIANDVRRKSGEGQRPLSMNKLRPDEQLFLIPFVWGTSRLTTRISPTSKLNLIYRTTKRTNKLEEDHRLHRETE